MQQITNVQTGAIPAARPTAATNVKAGARLAYIDVIRMILIILVIMVHAACTYGAYGDWTYTDRTLPADGVSTILLSLFNMVCQSFFMALFFFLSGYFTPGSYDRKGLGGFWKDRLMRLAIPMVIYTLFLSRVPVYINAVANEGVTTSIWQYSAQHFWSEADGGPTWFLFALLVFSLGYTLLRFVSNRRLEASRRLASSRRLDLSWASRLPAPSTKTLLAAGLAISAAMFALAQVMSIFQATEALETYNLLLAFFPAYILLFAGGMLAYRNQWLTQFPARMLRFWGWFSAALIVILPVYMVLGGSIDNGLDAFFGGLTWQCAGMCLWIGLACIAFSTTLTLWMRERVLPRSKLAAYAGPNTFTVYLIHPLVLVPVTYGMSFIALPALVKFGLASLLTVATCYLLADGLRRLPGARAIL